MRYETARRTGPIIVTQIETMEENFQHTFQLFQLLSNFICAFSLIFGNFKKGSKTQKFTDGVMGWVGSLRVDRVLGFPPARYLQPNPWQGYFRASDMQCLLHFGNV
jgi:hypothetical protein